MKKQARLPCFLFFPAEIIRSGFSSKSEESVKSGKPEKAALTFPIFWGIIIKYNRS
ncbi:MAG: hypothetical protein ACI4LH_01865 [Candidatus Heritagella sp.]